MSWVVKVPLHTFSKIQQIILFFRCSGSDPLSLGSALCFTHWVRVHSDFKCICRGSLQNQIHTLQAISAANSEKNFGMLFFKIGVPQMESYSQIIYNPTFRVNHLFHTVVKCDIWKPLVPLLLTGEISSKPWNTQPAETCSYLFMNKCLAKRLFYLIYNKLN